MSMSKRSLAVVWGLCATALFAAEPEQPRFLEALDECEALWHAEKYDQLYEYVGELERKSPERVSSRILFALRERRFGCKYANSWVPA